MMMTVLLNKITSKLYCFIPAFGVVGVVYYAVNIFLCTSDYAGNHCDKSMIAMHLLALIFVFVQMHFVFCNWKVLVIFANLA